ncbi:MAG: DUF721 domain-containing protein [Bacteroidales bacterium]|nr:DUF721 domain-containing protein [Bacteroidales bacterium]MCF8338441.1 DUF721 domain-containing protein [Bacteroidales bacterium]
MISDSNEQTLGNVIRQVLRSYGLEKKVNEQRIISNWEKVTGPMISKYTRNLRIRNHVLYVEITSSVVRNELNYAKEKLITALNEAAGQEVIKKIVIR